MLGLVEGGRADLEAVLLQHCGERPVDAFRVDLRDVLVTFFVPVLVPDGYTRPVSQNLDPFWLCPLAAGGAAFNGIEYGLATEAVLERRCRAHSCLYTVHQILHGMDEGVFVTEDVSWRPPGTGVGMVWFRHVHRTEALHIGVVFGEEHLELVHPLQVESHAALRAVDLEGVLVSAASGKAAGLERPYSTVLEARQEGRGVVHRNLPGLTAIVLQWPLLDERFGHSGDLCNRTDHEVGKVDDVSAYIAEGPGARDLFLEAPDQGKTWGHYEVLQVRGPPVPDLAQPTVLDEPPRQLHRGRPPVVEADHVNRAGVPGRRQHLAGFCEVVRKRLLAQDVLVRFQGREHDLPVRISRRNHVHKPDVVPRYELAVIRLVRLPA